MARGANEVQTQGSNGEDLEPYYRLIEMQKQMIDLIQQNAHTERTCAVLRERLVQEFEAGARPRRALPHRLRESAVVLFKRLLRRNGNASANPQRYADITWSQSFQIRNESSVTDQSRLTP